MTAATPSPTHVVPDRVHLLPIGIGAAAAHSLLMLPGYSQDGFDPAWFVMTAVSIALGIAVFALAVPGGGGTTGVVLGVLAALGSLAFWAMLSFPLAAGAAVVGLRARHEAPEHTRGTIAVALAGLAVAATLAITLYDAIANY